MKVKLQVAERINLLSILPREGNFIDLKIIRELRENLSFKDEEHGKLQFRYPWKCPKCGFIHQVVTSQVSFVKCPECGSGMQNTGQITWNGERAEEVEIEFSNRGFAIISEALEKLNNEKKLTEAHFNLYEKFCAEKESV